MKKQLFMMAATLCASAVFTACSSDVAESVQAVADNQDGYVIRVKANLPADVTLTRAISPTSEAETALTTSWAAGEKVYVYKNDGTELRGILTPTDITNGGKSCTLTGVIKGKDYTTADKLTYTYLKPKAGTTDPNNLLGGATFEHYFGDYSGQVGTLEDISANYDFCSAESEITGVTANGILLDWSNANFERQQAISKFLITLGDVHSAMVKPLTITATGLANTPLTVTPAVATDKIFVAMQNTTESSLACTFEGTVGGLVWTGEMTADMLNNKYYYTVIDENPEHHLRLYRDISSVTNIAVVVDDVKVDASLDGSNVSVSDNGNPMVQGTDYTVVYKKGDADATTADAEADNYTAVITGIGKYKGTKTSNAFAATNLPTAVITLTTGEGYVGDEEIIAQGATGWKVGATFTYEGQATPQTTGITYESSDDSGLSIDTDGNITANTPGVYTITIKVAALASTYNAATKTITIYVQKSGTGGTIEDPTAGAPAMWTD